MTELSYQIAHPYWCQPMWVLNGCGRNEAAAANNWAGNICGRVANAWGFEAGRGSNSIHQRKHFDRMALHIIIYVDKWPTSIAYILIHTMHMHEAVIRVYTQFKYRVHEHVLLYYLKVSDPHQIVHGAISEPRYVCVCVHC